MNKNRKNRSRMLCVVHLQNRKENASTNKNQIVKNRKYENDYSISIYLQLISIYL